MPEPGANIDGVLLGGPSGKGEGDPAHALHVVGAGGAPGCGGDVRGEALGHAGVCESGRSAGGSVGAAGFAGRDRRVAQ